MGHERDGAKQPQRFDPARAARLDDPARFDYLPPARVLELANVSSGTLLDFGTGTGTYALALARLAPQLDVLALDEQPEMLALLREKLARSPVPNVRPIEPGALPGLRGRVDGVLAVNVLHEIGDRDLDAMPALLAPHGRALFIDWDAAAERPVGPPREHVYDVNEAATRLERAGFRLLSRHAFPYHYAVVCEA